MTGEPDGGDKYHFNPGNNEDMSFTVVEAVSEIEDKNPKDCPPLYEAVDPDALDSLFEGEREGTVRFTYDEYAVSIYFADNRLTVQPIGEQSPDAK